VIDEPERAMEGCVQPKSGQIAVKIQLYWRSKVWRLAAVGHFNIARTERRVLHAGDSVNVAVSGNPGKEWLSSPLRSPPGQAREAIGDEARERPPWSARQRARLGRPGNFLNICFLKSGVYAMMFGLVGHKAAPIEASRRRTDQGKEIFYLDSL
jgi:hypothetical protein